MTAEKIDAAYAKTVMDDADSEFQTAYDRFFVACTRRQQKRIQSGQSRIRPGVRGP